MREWQSWSWCPGPRGDKLYRKIARPKASASERVPLASLSPGTLARRPAPSAADTWEREGLCGTRLAKKMKEPKAWRSAAPARAPVEQSDFYPQRRQPEEKGGNPLAKPARRHCCCGMQATGWVQQAGSFPSGGGPSGGRSVYLVAGCTSTVPAARAAAVPRRRHRGHRAASQLCRRVALPPSAPPAAEDSVVPCVPLSTLQPSLALLTQEHREGCREREARNSLSTRARLATTCSPLLASWAHKRSCLFARGTPRRQTRAESAAADEKADFWSSYDRFAVHVRARASLPSRRFTRLRALSRRTG